jgi:hypothetical protein
MSEISNQIDWVDRSSISQADIRDEIPDNVRRVQVKLGS